MNDDAAVQVVAEMLREWTDGECKMGEPEARRIVFELRQRGMLRTPGTVEVKPNLISVLREATAYAVRTYPPNGMPEQEPTDTWQSAIFVADAAIAAGENS